MFVVLTLLHVKTASNPSLKRFHAGEQHERDRELEKKTSSSLSEKDRCARGKSALECGIGKESLMQKKASSLLNMVNPAYTHMYAYTLHYVSMELKRQPLLTPDTITSNSASKRFGVENCHKPFDYKDKLKIKKDTDQLAFKAQEISGVRVCYDGNDKHKEYTKVNTKLRVKHRQMRARFIYKKM